MELWCRLLISTPDWLNTVTDPELSLQEYKTYLSEVLKLKYGKEINSVASRDKGAFGAFEVSPKNLQRFTGEIDTVPVVAVGDALISAEYRYGTGIENGVAEAYMLTSSLRLSGTKITIDENAWRRQQIDIPRYRGGNVDAVIGAHKERIRKDYGLKKSALLRAREEAYIHYTENPLEASDFDKLIFANHCKEKGDDFLKKSEWGKSEELYLEAIHLYEYCSENLSGSYAIEAMDKQIKTISNLGRSYRRLNNLDQSINCFLDAMSLAKKHKIMEMMDVNKLPKSLSEVVTLKLDNLGSDFQGKKEFLERLIYCLSLIEVDATEYNETLKATEIIISNMEKVIKFKSDINEGRPDPNIDVLNESTSSSKEASSIKNDSAL